MTLDSILGEMSGRRGKTNKPNHATFVSACHQAWIIRGEFDGCRISAGRDDKLWIVDILNVPAGDKTFMSAQILICHGK